MKIRSTVADLRAAVHAVAVSGNPTNLTNVTSRVRIAARDGKIVLAATDYDTEATAELEGEVGEEGAALPSIQAMEKVLQHQPDGATVTLMTDDKHRVRLEIGRGSVNLPGVDGEEWPEGLGGEWSDGLQLPPAEFRALLVSVAYARSRDLSRPGLVGVRVTLKQSSQNQLQIGARATDGHRMALNTITVEGLLAGAYQSAFTIPGEVVRRMLPRLIGAKDLALSFPVTTGGPFKAPASVRFHVGRTTLTTKTIPEDYPDFAKVTDAMVPAATIRVPKDKLLQAIEALTLVLGRKAPLIVSVAKNVLKLYASAAETGAALLRVEGACTVHDTGEVKSVGLPLQQLRDAVKGCGDEVDLLIPVGDVLEIRSADDAVYRQLIARVPIDKPLPDDRLPVAQDDDDDA